MSIYNALYGRDGHGVGPNEPEKKGFARFCQMVGRDLGQLLGTNLSPRRALILSSEG